MSLINRNDGIFQVELHNKGPDCCLHLIPIQNRKHLLFCQLSGPSIFRRQFVVDWSQGSENQVKAHKNHKHLKTVDYHVSPHIRSWSMYVFNVLCIKISIRYRRLAAQPRNRKLYYVLCYMQKIKYTATCKQHKVIFLTF